jgi:predicted carbohydrate-binding protein with CBM5 and CBM33 domain
MTARHRTSNWEYFIGGRRIATVDGGNRQPDAVVTHDIDLSSFPGRQTVLAVWNIGDTPMAFYSCVDLTVGGGWGAGTFRHPAPFGHHAAHHRTDDRRATAGCRTRRRRRRFLGPGSRVPGG